MNRWILWSWCAVQALVLTACGGGAPSAPSGEITQAQASQFRSTGGETTIELAAANDAEGVGGNFAGMGFSGRRTASLLNNGLRSLGRVGRTDCTLNKGNTTDVDADGIRDNSKDTYSCNFPGESSFTLDLTGDTTIKDDLVNATTGMFPKGGATVTPNLTLNISGSGEGGSFSGNIVTAGLWNFLLGETTASGKVEITQTYAVSAAGQSQSGKIGFYLGPWVVTPDDIANPFVKGAVSWTSYFQYEIGGVAYTLEGKTADLKYDQACPAARSNGAKYNSGSISWKDAADNEVKVVFASDCTSTWTYNGSNI